MASIESILSCVKTYAPQMDVHPILNAYALALRTHAGQMRKDGSPYIEHPLAVAQILAELHMDGDTIATALLHDALEDNPQTNLEMQAQVGPVVTELVDGVTKIGKLRFRSKEELQAENFRKMMLAVSKDLRVILVKLADRLHNMRTLEWHKPEKQVSISQETFEIYAPIANRLGLKHIKAELEDLCLRYLHPQEHDHILAWLADTAGDRASYIERVVTVLRDELTLRGIHGEVSGRAKAPSSIYRKMARATLDVDKIQDLLAFRILVDNLSDCYAMLGWVHARFEPLPGRIKDYIARPKPNGYQSLHTTVVGPHGRMIEVQIRTHAMHKVAEDGIAAHWQYKEGRLVLDPNHVAEITRIRAAFEAVHDAESPSDFMALLKGSFYGEEVFVLTPQGEVKMLPVQSTPVDFAYAIHSDVGDRCQGARVNGFWVSLSYQLQSADVVEILTDSRQKPRRGWLEFAKSPRAQAKIRRSLRLEEEAQALDVGKPMLHNELGRLGWTVARTLSEGRLQAYLDRRNLKVLDPVYGELARGTITVSDVAKAILPEGEWSSKQAQSRTSRLTKLLERMGTKRSRSPVLITGEDDLVVNYAGCCSPLPGEDVAGFVTRGRGITIHRINCATLATLELERRVEVMWDLGQKSRHSVNLVIRCENRTGILNDMTELCKDLGIDIERMEANPDKNAMGTVKVQIAVYDRAELTKLIRKTESLQGVTEVRRTG